MVDTKKLISSFLILASILSSLAFIFSGTSLKPNDREPQARASDSGNYTAEQPPTAPANAFVEKVTEDTSGQPVASIYAPIIINDNALPPLKPTSNLTEALAQYISRKLMAANPDGPTQDANGQMNIASPPIDDITAAMAQIPEIKNFKIPDWNAEIETAKLAIVNNPSKTDQEKYVESLGALFNKYYLRPDLTSVFYKDPKTTPPSELLPAAANLENAAKETKSAAVPAPFADFHKALLATVVYGKNAIAVGANAGEDPVKASLIMNAQQKNAEAAIANLENQFRKSGLQQILSERPETKAGVTAFLNNLIGIKTAYAQYPTWDFPSFSDFIRSVGQWIMENVQSILLQVLKNTIINTMQNQILDWARSGFQGKPAFITNWKGFFKDITDQTAGAIIQGFAPEICGPWQQALTLRFKSYYGGTSPFISSCVLSRIISNIEGFYNGFENGGWIAFGASTLPDNDYLGSIWVMGQKISSANAANTKAASDKAAAGQGFKNQAQCDNGFQLDENGDDCSRVNPDGSIDIRAARTTAPGYTAGNIITDTGTESQTHLVVNADNIIGLITAVAQSLFTRVIQHGF